MNPSMNVNNIYFTEGLLMYQYKVKRIQTSIKEIIECN